MKKSFISLVSALCLFVAPVSAYEWGGLVTNDSGVATPDLQNIAFRQGNTAALWLNAPLAEDNSFYFSSEVIYKFNMMNQDNESVFQNVVDLDLFKFTGDFIVGEGIVSVAAGRFTVIDSTGAVFAQNSDGVSVKYTLPQLMVSAYAGYTGLLNALNVSMNAAPENPGKFYALAYPYVPLSVSVEFPVLFGNQSLGFQGNAFIDLGSDKTNLFYGNIVVTGPITNAFYYNAATSFGSEGFKNVMNHSSLTFYGFPTQMFSMNAGVEYSSGENGPFATFKGVTASSAVISAVPTAMILPKVGITISDKDMSLDVVGKYVISCPEKKFENAGIEADLGFSYNIFNDLQIGFNVAGYFDLTSANANNYLAGLRVAFSF